jgi:hypothetical protein
LAFVFTIVYLNKEDFEAGFSSLMLLQTVCLVVFSFFAVYFISSTPKHPPRKVSLEPETPLEDLGNVGRQVWDNKNMLLIILTDCLAGACTFPFTNLLGLIFAPFGLTMT